jgi:hypothetical protein
MEVDGRRDEFACTALPFRNHGDMDHDNGRRKKRGIHHFVPRPKVETPQNTTKRRG